MSYQWAAANVGGGLLMAGGVLVSLITAVLAIQHQPYPRTTELLNYLLSGLTIVFGAFLVTTRRHVSSRLINVIPAAAAVMICVPSAVDKSPSSLGPLLLAWPVTFAASVLSARVAWVTMGVVAGAFVVLAAVSRGVDGLILWIEVTASLSVICWMVVRLQQQALLLRQALAGLARTDPLTGLVNRRGFDEALAREHARRLRGGPPMSLLLVDIDHFKTVNDSWGHQAGDRTLQQLSEMLVSRVRATDVVGRIGGEEFALLIPACELDQALSRAQELCDTVRTVAAEWEHPITISVGVATTQDSKAAPDTPEALFAAADAALYSAKEAGRDRVGYISRP